jgi:hypothetical protein
MSEMSDGLLRDIIRDAGMAVRRHQTIEEVEESEATVEAAKDALTTRYQIGKCGRENLPDQG